MSWICHFLKRIKPYKVTTRTLSREEIAVRCKQVSQNYQALNWVSPFFVYRKLVDSLAENSGFEVRPLKHLMEPIQGGKVVVSLRHDMDGDIVTGVRAARYLAKKGVPGSFFLLHTSHYYGALEKKVFYRFSGLESFVTELLATGVELGLHTDPLSLYCNHHLNGTQAIKTEILWLRSLGVNVSGTVAHNSAPVFGAENFEIFQGRSVGGRKRFLYQGKRWPLQTLNERKLGLFYEGNYPYLPSLLDGHKVNDYFALSTNGCLRKRVWQYYYFIDNPFFRRAYDEDIWLLGNDSWVIASRDATLGKLMFVNTDGLLAYLGEISAEKRIVISVHPEYISQH